MKLITLYRVFNDGDHKVDHVPEDIIDDLIGREDVEYAARLFVDEGIPTFWRIKGEYGQNDQNASEQAQIFFGN